MSTGSHSSFNDEIIEEFRANHGVVTSHRFDGMPMLLLHTVGAKTGEPRIHPLARFPDGDDHIVVGSAGGAPRTPGWVHNLRANPEVRVELGDGRIVDARASELEGDDHDRHWAAIAGERPVFERYLERAGRRIPLMRISPRRGAAPGSTT